MTKDELLALSFDPEECDPSRVTHLTFNRWRIHLWGRLKEVCEKTNLDEETLRFSPAWIYMLRSKQRLAESDMADAEELPFRMFEKYGDRFKVREEESPQEEHVEAKVEVAPQAETDETVAATETAVPEPDPEPEPQPIPSAQEFPESEEPTIGEVDWNAF